MTENSNELTTETGNDRKKIFYRNMIITFKVMSPLVLVIGLGIYFNHFVMTAMEADLAIAGSIMATALYGAIIIFLRLHTAKQDFTIIERFGREAAEGRSMTDLLDEPWIRRRYVRHYLKHIANTEGSLTSELDQNAIESELQALQEDYNSKLEFPQFLVGFMIAMGLLGTFIGLLETLTGISSMLSSMGASTESPEAQFKQLISELRKPLTGMGIAFSASMFGLVTSLMLAIMMTSLRHFISRVVMCARNVMHELTQINRKTIPGAGTGAAPVDQGRVGFRLSDSNSNMLTTRLDLLLKKLEVLFKSFENSISGTTRLNELLGFGPRMKETGERTLEELRATSASNVEQQRILQQLFDSQTLMATTMTAMLENQRRTANETTTAMRTLTERIAAAEEATIGSSKHLWDIKENFNRMGTLYDTLEVMATGISHQSTLSEALLAEAQGIRDWVAAGVNQIATAQEPKE